jgi:3-phenylpropionate/cinnamic acid dioxygenase small subunit
MNSDALLNEGRDLLMREGLYLDEQRWDDWLALFAPDCEFWVPSWRNNDELTTDPHVEVSHIYYTSRAGLEDRIARIRSKYMIASRPMLRTVHGVNAAIFRSPPTFDNMKLRSSWTNHAYFPRSRETHVFFGLSEHDLAFDGSAWVIKRKKIVLLNDFIPTMIDIYCI